jgi:hypothetical protein
MSFNFNEDGNIVLHWVNTTGKPKVSVLTPISYVNCEQVDALLSLGKGVTRTNRFHNRLKFKEHHPFNNSKIVRFRLEEVLRGIEKPIEDKSSHKN